MKTLVALALAAPLLCLAQPKPTAFEAELGSLLCRDHRGVRTAMWLAMGAESWRYEVWCMDGAYTTLLRTKKEYPR